MLDKLLRWLGRLRWTVVAALAILSCSLGWFLVFAAHCVAVSLLPQPPTIPVVQPSVHSDPHRPIFNAIRAVEGDDGKVGPAGERGPYRITEPYWTDAVGYASLWLNENPADWDYETRVYDARSCEHVMVWYWLRYHATTDEERARLHNPGAGPEYVRRVLNRAALENKP